MPGLSHIPNLFAPNILRQLHVVRTGHLARLLSKFYMNYFDDIKCFTQNLV